MPRKGPAPRRDLVSDPIHHSVLVTQIVNKVMLHGKRSLAEHIVYEAMTDSGYDPSSGKPPTSDQIQALQDASAKLDDAKVKTATDKVTAYFDEHCKPKG
jgi:small subunit ribosomal protein S7